MTTRPQQGYADPHDYEAPHDDYEAPPAYEALHEYGPRMRLEATSL